VKIKSVTIAATVDEQIGTIFKQLGAKEKEHNGNKILSIEATPEVMSEKVQIALGQLRRLGYNSGSQQKQHFWYITDKKKTLDTITIESQGKEGFVQERHEYHIYW
jgi:hypothetical protein